VDHRLRDRYAVIPVQKTEGDPLVLDSRAELHGHGYVLYPKHALPDRPRAHPATSSSSASLSSTVESGTADSSKPSQGSVFSDAMRRRAEAMSYAPGCSSRLSSSHLRGSATGGSWREIVVYLTIAAGRLPLRALSIMSFPSRSDFDLLVVIL